MDHITDSFMVDFDAFFKLYLQNRTLLRSDAHTPEGNKQLDFNDEQMLWDAIINGNDIYESRYLYLDNFKLLEWIPQSPGLFHAPGAEEDRRLGRRYLIPGTRGITLTPYGKAMEISGGIGCLRLQMKTVGGENLHFLGATSSGSAHGGFVVALSDNLYSRVYSLMKTHGAVLCGIEGEVRYWNETEYRLPVYSPREIPRIYLYVRDIKVDESHFPNRGELDVTAAVTFRGANAGPPLFTYSRFDPSVPGSITDCVKWIEDTYVKELFNGFVLTEFDEPIPHFENALFPPKVLMDPGLTADIVYKVSRFFGIYSEQNFINKLVAKATFVSNITVTGDGNVIGNNNNVITNINRKLGTRSPKLAESLALLRGEILQSTGIPEKDRNQSIRAIQDVEDEAADNNPVPDRIADGLHRTKKILEASSAASNEQTGWKKRLSDVVDVLKQTMPVVTPLLAAIL